MEPHARTARMSQIAAAFFRPMLARAWKSRRAFWLLLLIGIQAASGASRQADNPPAAKLPDKQTGAAAPGLVEGKAVERTLSGGESHSYLITMVSGEYLHAVIDQRGIDVVVALYGPDGAKMTEVDGPDGAEGSEPLSWIAETTGVYHLEVRSLEKDAKAGKYEAKIDTLRQSVPEDVHRIRAERSDIEAWMLAAEGTAKSLEKAIARFTDSLTEWRAAGETGKVAQALLLVARINYSLGEKQKALDYFSQGLAILRQVGNRRSEATTLNNIGGIYDDLGEKRKALEYYSQALPIFQQVGDRSNEAAALNNIGSVYSALGEKQKALDNYNQALVIVRQMGDRGGQAAASSNIGLVYSSLGEKQKALEYYNQALTILRQVGDRHGQAATLNNIGSAYSDLGEKQQALEYYSQTLAILQQVGDRRSEATTLNNIGSVYSDLGEKQKALDYYNQALPIRRQMNDRDGEATTLNNIGSVYDALGEKQKALDHYNQTLLIVQQMGDRRREAGTLNNIGSVYTALGEKQKALGYYNQALPIFRKVGDRRGEATTLNNIGSVHDSLGEKQKALDHYNQALLIFQQVGDRRSQAAALNSLGSVYSDLGEKQKALDYFNQALPIRRQVGDRSGEAATLHNIGGIYDDLDEKQKALDHYNQVLPIRRQVGDRSGEAATLNNLGFVYSTLGEEEKALDNYNQALALVRQVGDRRGEAITLNNLGSIYWSLGEKQKALDYFSQTLPIRRQVGDRRGQATTLYNISAVYRDRGRLDEALTNIEKALTIVESLRTKVTVEPLRASYTASIHELYEYTVDLLMSLHQQHPLQGFAAAALQASERGRARSLLELLNESHADITQGVEPSLLARKREVGQLFNAKAELLTRLLSNKQTEAQAEAAKREVDVLAMQYQQVEAEIRDKSPRYAALTQPQPLSLTEIQKLLDPDTLLLEYSLGLERSYLWAITHDSYKSYELPKASEIEAAAKEFYQSLQSPGPVRKSRRARTRADRVYTATEAGEVEALAGKLSMMLLSPVASMLGNKRLVVVPDGALQYLPFSALTDPARTTKREPLMLRHEIVSLPSASTLAIQRRELDGRKPAHRGAVVIADPVFSTDDNRYKSAQAANAEQVDGVDAKQVKSENKEPLYRLALARAVRDAGLQTGRGDLPRLPGTRIEAKEIVGLAGASQSKLIIDFAANRAAATSHDLSQYRYVHFATHGLLDSKNPELSALVLSLVDQQGRGQDGYLRAHEIFNLNLPAEVVVLSACETGLGKEIRGEGLVGLTRGFMYAGAKRVVVSLWRVNDRSTAELMKSFYRGMLRQGKRSAEALRAAQIGMWNQKQWRSPYYWAPFVLQGEWR
ncbi:MAG: CHAT domain-containing tetratricopeptide repeat protein [Blastocatellia bacterium]